MFFMISGFVILWSSINRDPLGFAVSRFSRLYPAFWTSIAFTALVILLLRDAVPKVTTPPLNARTILANATMMPAIFGARLIEGVYWTLEIELRFYALIFLLLLFRQIRHVEIWLYVWLAVAIAGLFVELPWATTYVALQPYGPFFVAGCLFYLVLSKGLTLPRTLGLGIAAASCVYISLGQRIQFITADRISAFVVPLLILGFFALFAVLSLRKKQSTALPYADSLGALTYPLYLTHAMMGLLLYEVLHQRLGATISLIVIIALAFGSKCVCFGVRSKRRASSSGRPGAASSRSSFRSHARARPPMPREL
jgi:peptidoglycan/LPS O-acetylase OafA/YrhL